MQIGNAVPPLLAKAIANHQSVSTMQHASASGYADILSNLNEDDRRIPN